MTPTTSEWRETERRVSRYRCFDLRFVWGFDRGLAKFNAGAAFVLDANVDQPPMSSTAGPLVRAKDEEANRPPSPPPGGGGGGDGGGGDDDDLGGAGAAAVAVAVPIMAVSSSPPVAVTAVTAETMSELSMEEFSRLAPADLQLPTLAQLERLRQPNSQLQAQLESLAEIVAKEPLPTPGAFFESEMAHLRTTEVAAGNDEELSMDEHNIA